jgi:tetratricopeptide (TPR) repeat protein
MYALQPPPLFDTHLDFLGRFYITVAEFFYHKQHDFPGAINFLQTSISLAISTGNTKRHSHAISNLATVNFMLGDYHTAQAHAYEAQILARISANLLREAQALDMEAMSWFALGNCKKSSALCIRARDLLNHCGMSGSNLDHYIMASQAEVYRFKSEYIDARSVHTQILEKTSVEQDPIHHAFTLLNIAEIDISMGAAEDDVLRNIEAARQIFSTQGLVLQVTMSEATLADLYLREGNNMAARTLFERCIKLSLRDSQVMSYCLDKLGDIRRWNASHYTSSWTTVFLVHSIQVKEKLGIYKALQFLGGNFFLQGDTDTAITLFTLALEGFTLMDVHRKRAECMLYLGDISKRNGDLLKAQELWEMAQPLFQQSSQGQQVRHIDERLAGINQDIFKQHQNNLAQLADLKAPSGSLEAIEAANVDRLGSVGEKEVGIMCR